MNLSFFQDNELMLKSRRIFFQRLLVVVVLLWALDPLGAQTSRQNLETQLQQIITGFKGNVAFAAKNLQTGETIEINSNEKVQTASVIKLSIMVEAFFQVKEARAQWEDLILLDQANKVQGSGILQDLSSGLIFTLHDAVTLMIVLSDNTATNLVIDKVGIDSVNSRMKKLGLENTRLFKKVFLPPENPSEEQKKFGLGVTTPSEMLRLLQMLYQGELVDKESSLAMIAILKKQRDSDQIPRYITYDESGENREGVSVANKTGALDRVRNDVGLVFSKKGAYAFAIFASNSADTHWTPDNAATLTVARLSKALYDYFSSVRQLGKK